MSPYLRLLRIEDQYIQFAAALAAGIYLRQNGPVIWLWAISTTFLSFAIFIINEIVDAKDTDKHSWNPVHIRQEAHLNKQIVTLMFITCSLIGLALAHYVRLFNWGLGFYFIGVAYSAPPLRFKALPVLDILAQISVWWIIPFLAPISLMSGLDGPTIWFTIALSLLIWCIFYPYQLADIQADKAANLHNTHVLLGLNTSLIFGALLGIIGLALYLSLSLRLTQSWSLVLFLFTLYSLYYYAVTFRLSSRDQKIKYIQDKVVQVKPFARLFPLIATFGLFFL